MNEPISERLSKLALRAGRAEPSWGHERDARVQRTVTARWIAGRRRTRTLAVGVSAVAFAAVFALVVRSGRGRSVDPSEQRDLVQTHGMAPITLALGDGGLEASGDGARN